MLTTDQFQRLLHDALNSLYEPHRLRQSPLAALFGVAARFDTPSALQRILIQAIESLRPGDDEPPQSRAWQIYEPLFYRYVEQLSQPEVADQLGLSVRHLRRKERSAVQALANLLWERFELDVRPSQDTALEAAAMGEPEHPDMHEELAWLKGGLQSEPTSLDGTLPGVLALARGLAERYGVTLHIRVADDLPRVTADPVALKQGVLSLLSVAIPRAAGGRLAISARLLRWEVEIRVHCAEYPSGLKPALSSESASLRVAQQLADLSGASLTLSVDARAFDARLLLPAVEQLPVLAIDDNADALQLLHRYTSGTRYRLVTTRDPEQVQALVQKVSPAIIVLDVMMPKVDGWEVLGQLRQHPLTRHIPVIVCTILPQEEWAHFLGASAYLRKPLARETLLATLDEQIPLMKPESR
jgi:CheY-like chemotaxis protein